jgi:UPF0042 nucleotide-binding protein
MSGSGRSFALKSLEDMGFETIDNLPLSLLESVALANRNVHRPLAISVDVRTRDFSTGPFLQLLQKLRSDVNTNTQLVFFECDDDILARRYNESRRLHPLAHERPVKDGLRLERNLIEPLKDSADIVIDTSLLSTSDLRGQLRRFFLPKKAPGLGIFVVSFSFRHGLPREADMVFDARLLKNPFYDEGLRPFSGEDHEVAEFIKKDSVLKTYMTSLKGLISESLPRFEEEGRGYLTIAVGCTGGQHRSVFIAKEISEWLQTTKNNVKLKHRDLTKRKNV